jgi:lysine 2,3-aminomutase
MKQLDTIVLGIKSRRLLQALLHENPELAEIVKNTRSFGEFLIALRASVMERIESRPAAWRFITGHDSDHSVYEALDWSDLAAIRLLDTVNNEGREVDDPNRREEVTTCDTLQMLWLGARFGTGGAEPAFFEDMIELFRQYEGRRRSPIPRREELEAWMDRHPSGLEPRMIALRLENRERIIGILIDKLDSGVIKSKRYRFEPGMTRDQKLERVLEWWQDSSFHIRFAVRSPELLDEMLGYSLDEETMELLREAKRAGIPFFVNPYYLSLLNVHTPDFAVGADLAIRDYVIYSKQLVEEFGSIEAWEKEDIVEVGKPNAAGWILPSQHEIHRRYPEVAIMIPASRGRACGGLCASCQRMYDFQKGNLNFNIEKLAPNERFEQRMAKHMVYFRDDSQLRDILITGGDALMSSNKTLRKVFAAVLEMAAEKRAANRQRRDGEKYAEMVRVRLGTRIPAYIPQRVTPELCEVLAEFKRDASELGIEQFVIQTHFESAMEITPESKLAIERLLAAGWMVTNQLVFTAAASRRGHSAKLRQVLNDLGVLPYYTFSVKGFRENSKGFATNARLVQEWREEKIFGAIPFEHGERIRRFAETPERMRAAIAELRETAGLPFLGTDRNVLNLPGVGKSMTFRTIGVTRDGRRILEFDHDSGRNHSPIIEQMGKVVIVEAKSISEYLRQLEEMGEDPRDYQGIYGYSLSVTERREPVYEYPEYDFTVTKTITNLELDHLPYSRSGRRCPRSPHRAPRPFSDSHSQPS